MLPEKLVRPIKSFTMLERQYTNQHFFDFCPFLHIFFFAEPQHVILGGLGGFLPFFLILAGVWCASWTSKLLGGLKSVSCPVRAPTDPVRLQAGLCYNRKETGVVTLVCWIPCSSRGWDQRSCDMAVWCFVSVHGGNPKHKNYDSLNKILNTAVWDQWMRQFLEFFRPVNRFDQCRYH